MLKPRDYFYTAEIIESQKFHFKLFKKGDIDMYLDRNYQGTNRIILSLIDTYDYQQLVSREPNVKFSQSDYNEVKLIVLEILLELGSQDQKIQKILNILVEIFQEMKEIAYPEYYELKESIDEYKEKLQIEKNSQYTLKNNKVDLYIQNFRFDFQNSCKKYSANKFKNTMVQNLFNRVLNKYYPTKHQITEEFQIIKNKQALKQALMEQKLFSPQKLKDATQYNFVDHYYIESRNQQY